MDSASPALPTTWTVSVADVVCDACDAQISVGASAAACVGCELVYRCAACAPQFVECTACRRSGFCAACCVDTLSQFLDEAWRRGLGYATCADCARCS